MRGESDSAPWTRLNHPAPQVRRNPRSVRRRGLLFRTVVVGRPQRYFALLSLGPAKLRGLTAAVAFAVIVLGAGQSAGSTPPAASASKCVSRGGLPDLHCTPGALNRNVKQRNIKRTICVPNWTDTVRPPTSYTNELKDQGIEDYGFRDKVRGHYEEDHLIPLAVGGSPRSEEPLARAVQGQVGRPREGQAGTVPSWPRLR
jgi:hypothetical protein